ncbi:type II toxin-antitoxin system HipA family toxin [Nocardia camponoti]|uniref:Phosphatidylinositol kinase n=1 Tax=Nocardia camponoti TaxID=1616106 RepID=A0A917V8V7_9NOCA|nr:type II toxin-antitoxin system HipA family toxin [Nocardia camponoti]GGK51278.1 phosphatidylinositol kinase [Nocardia camponoti]
MTDQLAVWVDINGETVPVGTAYFTHRGSLATAFGYRQDYLRRPDAYALDPSLPLYQGQHHVASLPGAFADSAPDRWGRNLIRQRLRGRDQSTKARALTSVDFLTGVGDYTRQGALRFSAEGASDFLDPDSAVPKMIELPQLLRAADHLARDDHDFSDLKLLLAAGTATLGGARPKASVRDGDTLYIAKFGHHADNWDVMAWEKTAIDLAELAGIATPRHSLHRVDGRGVLVLERFDREGSTRIGYVSAMTMIGGRDGGGHDYLDVIEELPDQGDQPAEDLAALWRRVAFSVAIHNTDDHLRNHGFLRTRGGWRLAPVFDINPNPEAAEPRMTSIAGARVGAEEVDGLAVLAEACGIGPRQAATILSEVLAATAQWESVAARNGIGASERSRFTSAFENLRPALTEFIAASG